LTDALQDNTGSSEDAITHVGAALFKSQCLQIMDQVSESGEEVVITKHGQPVAKLVPVSSHQERAPILGACKGSLIIFDEDGLVPSTREEWTEWEKKLEDPAKDSSCP